MKRISEEAVARAALAKGAVVEIDGRRLNAAASRRPVAMPAPEPAAAPALPPAAPIAVTLDAAGLERAAHAQAGQVQALGQMVAALVAEMRAQRAADPRPVEGWDFDVTRDKDNNMRIRARIIRSK